MGGVTALLARGASARERTIRLHRWFAAEGHSLPLRLWDGTVLGPDDRGYRLVLRHPWSLRAILIPGTDLAVGEAYVADHFDVEGSMVQALRDAASLADLLRRPMVKVRAAVAVLALPQPPTERAMVAEGLRLPGRLHSKARDAAAVRFHYDTGNDFYATFLDERMVYSCGYFRPEDDLDPADAESAALERAQFRKLELVCRKLGLRPGMRLLDIGCGWGALVIHAARHHGVTATGITLSPEQAVLARQRARAAGVADHVTVRVQDYRDLTGTWDAIASIGMVEHVGTGMLPEYFAVINAHLAEGGRLLNHGITTGQRPEVRDLSTARGSFVGRYVFPDGALVPSGTMVSEAERAGLEVVDLQQLRPHYARTLQHWVHRLEQAHDRAVAAASETAYRIWRAYMAGSVVGFETNDLGVIQLLCLRGARPPLERPWAVPQEVDVTSEERARRDDPGGRVLQR